MRYTIMIDLEQVSGLPMELTDDNHLKLKPGVIQTGDTYERKFTDLESVYMDKDITAPAEVVYLGYRGLCLANDKETIEKQKLSYDITIMPPMMLGDEFNKTLGHYHSAIPGSKIEYPEMYEILHGKGLFLLQKLDDEQKKIITILAIEANIGDKIIYPPNYGHIFVNIGQEVLVTANWVSSENKSNYEPIKQKHGMALYVVPGNEDKPTFIKNENYPDQPLMRKMNITDRILADFGFDKQPMYTAGVKNAKLLDFLNHPSKYAVELSALSS